ncbi:acyltransferase [Curtobacterium sp. MCBD17_035]|uniref:acyltransferase family protein n=1 Tax=Curtobacterium sp. MCBD17_035 TaxID=2175673 RepID=UPI000DAA5369|nr:acyltransferase [Curtobacterium sp. MCBD17_035]WIB67970.1 acyltransferase [Curtobacterium sp. MCBD17_035]
MGSAGRGEDLRASSSAGEARGELTNLTGIRAVAAGWVVVEHFRLVLIALLPALAPVRPWIGGGYLGVEVFFVLSGFVISYNYAERLGQPAWGSYRRFVMLRIARLYPTHLVTLLAMLVLVVGATRTGIHLSAGANYTLPSFLGNLVLLQATPTVPAWNPPAWSISAEFGAYICFPLLAMALGKLRRLSTALVLTAVIAVGGAIGMASVQAAGASVTGPALVPMRITIEFSLGALLYVVWRKLPGISRGTWNWVAVAGVLGAVVLIGVLPEDASLASLPFLALMVLACAKAGGVVGAILSSRILMWGGRVSYSVYMTHFIVLMVMDHLLPRAHFAGNGIVIRVAVVIVYIAVAVAVGWLCYRFIEEPSRLYLRKALRHRSAPESVTERITVGSLPPEASD